MIQFGFDALSADGPLHENWQIVFNISGDLQVTVDGSLAWTCPSTNLVELAVALQAWLREGIHKSEDFELESVDFEEKGVLWIRRTDEGWRVGSIHHGEIGHKVHGDSDIRRAIEEYGNVLTDAVRSKWNVDIAGFLTGARQY